MKVFISQPMRGKTDEQIRKERNKVIANIEYVYRDGVEILDSVFDLEEGTGGLVYLGKSIELMDEADLVYFMEGWDEARGCVIEHETAVRYGIKRIYEGRLTI